MLRRRGKSDDATERAVAEPAGPPSGHVISLDYPVQPRSRFGHGRPTNEPMRAAIAAGEDRYRARLEQVVACSDALQRIPIDASTAAPDEPRWVNGWLPGLDGASLYSILAHENPQTYLEVGSGNSTLFARRAIRDHGLRTQIVSIDPFPRAEIDALCDEVVRAPVEDVDVTMFSKLGAGDVLFVDNSHRVFTNSDATVMFMEVLPALPAGTLVHFHDVFLPDDYPDAWNDRYYSEQYVLAAFLLGGQEVFRTELPCWYVAHHAPHLAAMVQPLFDALPTVERHGNSYWVVTT